MASEGAQTLGGRTKTRALEILESAEDILQLG
jgi:hypothetical protein